jgi:hypothetical protein
MKITINSLNSHSSYSFVDNEFLFMFDEHNNIKNFIENESDINEVSIEESKEKISSILNKIRYKKTNELSVVTFMYKEKESNINVKEIFKKYINSKIDNLNIVLYTTYKNEINSEFFISIFINKFKIKEELSSLFIKFLKEDSNGWVVNFIRNNERYFNSNNEYSIYYEEILNVLGKSTNYENTNMKYLIEEIKKEIENFDIYYFYDSISTFSTDIMIENMLKIINNEKQKQIKIKIKTNEKDIKTEEESSKEFIEEVEEEIAEELEYKDIKENIEEYINKYEEIKKLEEKTNNSIIVNNEESEFKKEEYERFASQSYDYIEEETDEKEHIEFIGVNEMMNMLKENTINIETSELNTIEEDNNIEELKKTDKKEEVELKIETNESQSENNNKEIKQEINVVNIDSNKDSKSEIFNKYKEEEKKKELENSLETEYDFSDIQVNKVNGVGLYQRESELLFFNEYHIQTVFRNNLYEEYGLEEDEIEEFIKSLYVIKTPANMFRKSVVSDKLNRFLKIVLRNYSYEESIEDSRTELNKRLSLLENDVSVEEYSYLKSYFDRNNSIEDILSILSIQIKTITINKYLYNGFIKKCLSNLENQIKNELSNFKINKKNNNVEVIENGKEDNIVEVVEENIKAAEEVEVDNGINKAESIRKSIEKKEIVNEVVEIKEVIKDKEETENHFNKIIEEKDLNIKLMIEKINKLEEEKKDINSDLKNENVLLKQKIESFETTLSDKNNEIKRVIEEKKENKIQFEKNIEKTESLYKTIIEELKENQEFIKNQIKLNEENNIRNNESRNNDKNLIISLRDKEIMNLKQQIEKMEDETYTKEEIRENYTHNDKLEEYYITIKQSEEMLLKERESIQIKIENSNQNLKNELESNWKRKESMLVEEFKSKEIELKKVITKNKKLTAFYKVNMDQELTDEEQKDREFEDFILEMISEYGFNGEKLQKQLINRGYSFS